MIYLMLSVLIAITLVTMIVEKGDIISPSFIFSGVFVFSTIWLVVFANEWDFSLHFNTFLVITGGVLVFVLSCYLREKSHYSIKRSFKNNSNQSRILPIEIDNWKLALFVIIETFTVFYSTYLKLQFAGGSFVTLFATMSSYRASVLIYGAEAATFPKWLNLLNSIVTSSGYWFAYVLANNYLCKKKINVLQLTAYLICVMGTVFTTSRGGTFDYLIAIIIFFVVLTRVKSNKRRKTNFKTILKIFLILALFVVSLQAIGNLIGRGSEETVGDYLARYCGAEIANLDKYLNSRTTVTGNNDLWGSQTFIYVIRWIGSKIGLQNTMYDLDLPFIKVNGKNLGNVYTTFYPYIYDFGYFGVVSLTAVMGLISSGIYQKVLKTGYDYKPNRYVLMYGFLLPTLAMSFFSNKFYEKLFNPSFMYTFIFWIVFEYMFCPKAKKKIKIFNRTRSITAQNNVVQINKSM